MKVNWKGVREDNTERAERRSDNSKDVFKSHREAQIILCLFNYIYA